VHERANDASVALARSLGWPVYSGALAVLDPRAHAPQTAACLLEVDYASDLDAAADALYRGISAQLGDAETCPWWMPEDRSDDYLQYAQPQTWGRVRLLINGHGAVDRSDPFDMMQFAVEGTNRGDAVYLASWMFDPATPLTRKSSTGKTWGDLIGGKARDGVTFRLILNDFNPISRWHSNLTGLDALVMALPPGQRDQIQYLLSRQPAHILVPELVAKLAGVAGGDQHVGTHHQKFMVVRRGEQLIAFCGGVDIIPGMTPARWTTTPWRGWHDLQVQLEGPITRDLEKEFAWRWNRELDASRRDPLPGWSPFEDLALTPLSTLEQNLGFYPSAVQMLRTVSESTGDEPTAFHRTRRDDIRQAYQHGIACAQRFLYLENQYFRTPELADWIVARGKEQPDLVVIIVVVDAAMAAADDGKNPITDKGFHLQHETFDRLLNGLGADRVRFYMMKRRYVHAKLILADDLWCCIGSANVNPRSFELDSELNVQLREHDPDVILGFRKSLWTHNLGVPEAKIESWAPSEFLDRWDKIAAANARGAGQGEVILRFDYTKFPGRDSPIPDALVDLGVPGDQVALEDDAPTAALAGRFGPT
jgi:phosphatidylserine/phosphatidylglycerophosphate/cardiolipin synthase-like enzyme